MNKFFGAIMAVLGIVALFLPRVGDIASIFYVAIPLIITGCLEMSQAGSNSSWAKRLFWLIIGVCTVACAVYLFVNWQFGVELISIVVAIYFIVEGIFKLTAAIKIFQFRKWLLVNGLVSLAFGAYIAWLLYQQPGSAAWIISTLFGINMLFKGFTVFTAESK